MLFCSILEDKGMGALIALECRVGQIGKGALQIYPVIDFLVVCKHYDCMLTPVNSVFPFKTLGIIACPKPVTPIP